MKCPGKQIKMSRWSDFKDEAGRAFYHLYGFLWTDNRQWMDYRKGVLYDAAKRGKFGAGPAKALLSWLDKKWSGIITDSDAYKAAVEAAVEPAAEKFNSELYRIRRSFSQANGRLAKKLQRASGFATRTFIEAKEKEKEAEGLQARVVSLEDEKKGLEQAVASKEEVLAAKNKITARQAEVTQALYSQLRASEAALHLVREPVVLVDSRLRVVDANAEFTNRFGYGIDDLAEELAHVRGTPEGDVNYDRRGISFANLLANSANFRRLGVLNEFFHPRVRRTFDYEICLLVKPKKGTSKTGFLNRGEYDGNESVAYRALVTVSTDNGKFIGASLLLHSLSSRQIRKIATSYISKRAAVVTAAESVGRAEAEKYIKEASDMDTHDLTRGARKRNPLSAEVTIDFINTTSIDRSAVDVLCEMYAYCSSREGDHITINLINASKDLRNKMFSLGMPAKMLPKVQKIRPEYEAPPEALPSLSSMD